MSSWLRYFSLRKAQETADVAEEGSDNDEKLPQKAGSVSSGINDEGIPIHEDDLNPGELTFEEGMLFLPFLS